MNAKVKEVLEKIVLDEKLCKELFNLSEDKVFNFFLKHSDSNFTQEGLEKTLSEIFVSASEDFNMDNLSEEDLEMVGGGANFWQKAVAIPLAAFSIMGVVPTGFKNLDFTPKASAGWFSKTKFNVTSPLEMNEIKEFLKTDSYYSTKAALPADIDGDENKAAFETWWKNVINVKHSQDDTQAGGAILGLFGGVADMGEQIQKKQDLQYRKRELARLQREHGQPRGYGGNYDHNAEMAQLQGEIDALEQELAPRAAVIKDGELPAVDRLLKKYADCVLGENGVQSKNFDSDVFNLIKFQAFEDTVNRSFGTFVVREASGWFEGPKNTFIEIPASERLLSLVMSRGEEMDKAELKILMSKAKRNLPAIGGLGALFLGTSSLEKIKGLLVSAGMWTKAGAIKAYNRFIYNRLTLEKDPVKLKELMSEFLKSSVLRQDKAMDKIVEIMGGMADLWEKSDETGVPCTSACTMAFLGDSGVGKTYAARMLSKALFKKDMQPWQFVTSTSITGSAVSSTNKKEGEATQGEQLSPADQLFNINSELIRQLRLNNRVIIVVDEIDKIHKNDPNDTILERLRDARDTGKLLVRNGVNYEHIDVSRTVFICISNELRECWGLPKVELTPAQSAARTNIERDRSLVNRFEVIEFNYFNKDDYAFILRPQINEVKEYYLVKFNVDLEITNELIESIGEAAEKKNKGVRGVNDYLVLLHGKLVDYRSQNKVIANKKSGDTSNPVRKIKAIFDEKENTFKFDSVAA